MDMQIYAPLPYMIITMRLQDYCLSILLLFLFPTALTQEDNPPPMTLSSSTAVPPPGSNTTDISHRSWETDDPYMYAQGNAANFFKVSTAYPSVPDPVPYQTARVFYSAFNYSFTLNVMGHKFIRLYFYPDTYAELDTVRSFFSVKFNSLTLLSNFSAFLNFQYLEPSYMKEFVIYVDQDMRINLTFIPNPNSFAFINGIEIVSLPDRLYNFWNMPIKYLSHQLHDFQINTALETLHRLNVGGAHDVEKHDDTGMFRYWIQDDTYIHGNFGFTRHENDIIINYTADTPSYTAPEIVYRTYRTLSNTSKSLEWGFPVDSGFHYLLRFHFCEIQLEVTEANDRVCTIQLDNKTAELSVDVIYWTGGTGIPIFKDYITRVPDDGRHGKKDLRLSLFPNNKGLPKYSSVLLNGLEIYKLSDSNLSLAAANPESGVTYYLSPLPPPIEKKKNGGSFIISVGVGSAVVFLVIVFAICFLISRCRRKLREADIMNMEQTSASGIPLPSHICRQFSLQEIITATHNFDENLLIGKGGFGNVYKGFINGGTTIVAIKRLKVSSNQGAREFLTEIKLLSKLRHVHLVSLIGYCNDNREMILAYEYMAQGTLRGHLCNSDYPPLPWKQRLKICLGAAKGLSYLHTGVNRTIIHRDVKSTNVLLDEKLVAKMSDFGLSKLGPTDPEKTYVSTAVKGSISYIDPEYYQRKQLTDKSDIFSFGVVLFEVLCNRPAVLADLPREEANLADWVKSCYREGIVERTIDPNMKAQIAPECLHKFVETGIRCIRRHGIKRPTMIDVVWSLEFALKLQVAAEEGTSNNNSGGNFENSISAFQLIGPRDSDTTGEMFPGPTDETQPPPLESGEQWFTGTRGVF